MLTKLEHLEVASPHFSKACMEFILKHGQFAHLRDSADMPESICPCHQQTMTLIGLYIDQGNLLEGIVGRSSVTRSVG